MVKINYRSLLRLTVPLAIRAGQAILTTRQQGYRAYMKKDNSPVTLADKRSNQIICEALARHKMSYPLLTEEGQKIPFAKRKNWTTFWLIDPLDGTKEFIRESPEFTVNIALIHRGQPVLGVIYAPALNLLYFAAKNIGAYKKENASSMRKTTNPIKSSERIKLKKHSNRSLRVVTSYSHSTEEINAFLKNLKRKGQIELFPVGSSLKFGCVADGQADIYPRFGPTMEWDTAAGQAIVEQAGGVVLNQTTGKILKYNKANLLNPSFVVKKI